MTAGEEPTLFFCLVNRDFKPAILIFQRWSNLMNIFFNRVLREPAGSLGYATGALNLESGTKSQWHPIKDVYQTSVATMAPRHWSSKNGVHFLRHPRCQLGNRRSYCKGGETGCCSQSSRWIEFNKTARVVCFGNHRGHRFFFQWWILELHVDFWMRLTFFLSTKVHQALKELVRRPG